MTQIIRFHRSHKYLPFLIYSILFILSGCGDSSSTGYGNVVAPLPVVSQGRIFVNNGILHLFNQQTGASVGNYQLNNPKLAFRSGPVIANGSLYIIGDENAAEAHQAVYALQEKNGALLWRTPINLPSIREVTDTLMYVTSNPMLMALQANTGAIRWQYPLGSTTVEVNSVIVSQGILYACTSDASLYAFDAETGKLLWRRTIGTQALSGLATVNGILYLSTRTGMYALKASDGASLWQRTLNGGGNSDTVSYPLIVNDTLYTIVSSKDVNSAYALNRKDGQVIWPHAFAESGAVGQDFFAVTDTTLLYGDTYHLPYSANPTGNQGAALTALRTSDGSMLWKDWIGGFYDPALSVENETVYVVSDDSSSAPFLNAWQIQTGKLLWKMPIPT